MKKITHIIISLVLIMLFLYFSNIIPSFSYSRIQAVNALKMQLYSIPELGSNYKQDGTSLILNNIEDKDLRVSIGDARGKEFKPELNLDKWQGEVKMKISAPTDSQEVSFDKEKIKINTENIEYRMYDISTAENSGKFELDAIVKEKPNTDVFEWNIETENLDFFYQAPLDEERERSLSRGASAEWDGVTCIPTECKNKQGIPVMQRPENVVGSYAVYYKGGKSGDYSKMGGKNYKTGKAFHIYRPLVTDAKGKKVWGTLNVDTKTNKLSVTISKSFLNSATYPIIVDPTFGYEGSGETELTSINNRAYLSLGIPVEGGGTVNTVKISARKVPASMSDSVGKGVIWLNSNGTIITNGVGGTVTINNATKQWWTMTYTTVPTIINGTPYLVGVVLDGTNANLYYDSGSSGEGGYDTNVYATPENLDAVPATNSTYKFGIYATYTVTPKPAGSVQIKSGVKIKGGVGIGGAKITNPASQSLVVTDNFNRADENPLGNGNWTVATGFQPLKIVNNQVQPAFAFGITQIEYWSSNTFNDNQYSQATIVNLANACGLALNFSGNNGYTAWYHGSDDVRLQQVTNGTPTTLTTWGSLGIGAGQVMKLTNVGGVITLYLNGSQKGTYDDSASPVTGGSPGLETYGTSFVATFDDWEGGNI
ncbi:MAG: hypothetical protein AAB446_00115 [Patescibacteria group bacterium]